MEYMTSAEYTREKFGNVCERHNEVYGAECSKCEEELYSYYEALDEDMEQITRMLEGR